MKSYLKLLTVFFAACVAATIAVAADASPAGTWTWKMKGRGGAEIEQTLKLDLQNGTLSGTLLGAQTPMGEIPDVAIQNASFKDGVVKFTVTRHFGDREFTSSYEGKLEGDAITGSVERPGRDGETRKSEWKATRSK